MQNFQHCLCHNAGSIFPRHNLRPLHVISLYTAYLRYDDLTFLSLHQDLTSSAPPSGLELESQKGVKADFREALMEKKR